MDVEEKRPVRWLAVLGGLVIGWIAGAVVGLGFAFGTFAVLNRSSAAVPIVPLAVTVLLSWVVYMLARKSDHDLAVGMLIGGCMMALVGGACGALLSGLQNMH